MLAEKPQPIVQARADPDWSCTGRATPPRRAGVNKLTSSAAVIGDIFQPTHLLFLLVIVLLVLGPKRLPEMARSLGRGFRDFKDAISGEEHPAVTELQQQPIPPTASEAVASTDPEPTVHSEADPVAPSEPEPVTLPAPEPVASQASKPVEGD